MRVPRLAIVSSTVLAATLTLVAPPSARAWITQTTDNSPTPTPWFPAQWWHWRTKPKKAPPPPCRSKYCPPYYSETHGYTPAHWRPWPGTEQKATAAPKADVNPPAETTSPAKSAAAPMSLPEAVEAPARKK
jgi:hypothetical protein